MGGKVRRQQDVPTEEQKRISELDNSVDYQPLLEDSSRSADTPVLAEHEDAICRLLDEGLEGLVHTHTSKIPYGGDIKGSVTDEASLGGQRVPGKYVTSTTIDGAYRAAVASSSRNVGLATAIGSDFGRPDGKSALDLALDQDRDGLIQAGLSAATADRFCHEASRLRSMAPDGPRPDQPTLFFEANGEEVAVTPVTSVRVLQQIHARVVFDSSFESRLTCRIRQGGDYPLNTSYYVASAPAWDAGKLLGKRNSRYGGYAAFRVRCPVGVRSRLERDVALVVATGSLLQVCRVARADAAAYRERAIVGLLVPGANIRLGVIRDAEKRDAARLVRVYLDPLRGIRSAIKRMGLAARYAFKRLPASSRAWLRVKVTDKDIGHPTTKDIKHLSAEMAEDLILKIEQAARGALPPTSREALRSAFPIALSKVE